MKKFFNTSNIYVRSDFIRTPQELEDIEQITTNIEDFSEFMEHLKDFYQENHDESTRVAETLTFLLPLDFKYSYKEIAKRLTEELFEDYPNVPWIASVEKRGKGTYLTISFVSREYYKEARTIYQIAPKNKYKNSKTHRFCKEDDPDAYLAVKEGDITWVEENRHFGYKIKKFTQGIAAKRAEMIKELYSKVLEEFSCPTEDAVVIHRQDYTNFNNGSRKRALARNTAIRAIEYRLNDVYTVLKQGFYIQDQKIKTKFVQFVSEISKYTQTTSVRYQNISLALEFDTPFMQFMQNLQYLKEKIFRKIEEFCEKYIYDRKFL